MLAKKLKLLTNQRKITDFKADFVPQNQNGPSDTPQTPSEDETADVSDEKSSEKRDFQPRWLNEHHWLNYDKTTNKMFCNLCLSIGAKNALTSGTDNFKLQHYIGM